MPGFYPSLPLGQESQDRPTPWYTTALHMKLQGRDEFTVKVLRSMFCDKKIESRSSWCDLCSMQFFCGFWKKIFVELCDAFLAQPV